MQSIRDYIDLINEADGVTTTQLTPDQYQAKMAQANALRQQQGQAALPVTPSNQIATPTAAQATPTTTPAQAAAPAAKQWQPGVLGMGTSGPEVSALQKKLGVTADGKFGPGTQQAVMALQKKLGVTQDGAYGPLTKAAHEKQGGRPKDGTNQAEPGQPGYTTGAKKSEVQTGAAKQAAGRAELSAQTTDPDKTSLNARVTTAIPTVATPAGNPSGVGKNQTLTPAEKKNAEDALKDPNVGMADKAYFAGLLGVPVPKQKTAPNVGAPAPITAPAPVATTTPPARPTSAVTADPTATTFPDGTPIERSQGNSSPAYMNQFGGSAPNQGGPATTTTPAPAQAANTTPPAPATSNVGPRPVNIAQARQWAAKYAQTHDPKTGAPIQETMTRSDKILLDKMLTIAGLR